MSIFGSGPGLLETLVSDDLDATDNNGQRLADLLRESDPRAYNRAVVRNAKRLAVPVLPRMTKAQLREVAPQLLQAVEMLEQQERDLRRRERELQEHEYQEQAAQETETAGGVIDAEFVVSEGHAGESEEPLLLRPLNEQARNEAKAQARRQAQT